jgi:hypothetical protein
VTGLDGPAFAQSQADAARVDGDAARQALASLRGYAYQLYASAPAWIALTPDETLHLEVAEDYAVSARERLNAAQIKDAPASGKLTLRHPDVIAAIDSYVEQAELARAMRLIILTRNGAKFSGTVEQSDRAAWLSWFELLRRVAEDQDDDPLEHICRPTPVPSPHDEGGFEYTVDGLRIEVSA